MVFISIYAKTRCSLKKSSSQDNCTLKVILLGCEKRWMRNLLTFILSDNKISIIIFPPRIRIVNRVEMKWQGRVRSSSSLLSHIRYLDLPPPSLRGRNVRFWNENIYGIPIKGKQELLTQTSKIPKTLYWVTSTAKFRALMIAIDRI